MGLRNWAHNKKMKDPVTGTLQLTSCSGNSGGAMYENCHMSGVVTAPGLTPTAVEHYCTAPTKRWPYPGQTLPVTVDRSDPTRLHVEWDQIPTGRDQGMQQAQYLAQSMQGYPSPAPAGSHAPPGAYDASGVSNLSNLNLAGLGPALEQFIRQAEAQGANVTTNVSYSVLGAPGRPMPGQPGGGMTPEQAAAASTNGSMQPASATVLAVHDVPIPPGMVGQTAGGTADITLDVIPASGPGWTATTRISFSTADKRARVATVGLVLPVLINPDAHDQIAIDVSRLSG